MRLVARFVKEDKLKYISHLDIMRTFHRAARRSMLPFSFTQGFNPHPKISFASALPVGLSSEGEYVDFELENETETDKILEKLNFVLPEGLRITEVVAIDPKAPSLMSKIELALYRISIPGNPSDGDTQINRILDKPIILVNIDKSNRSEQVNIRPMIVWIKNCSTQKTENVIYAMLHSGSKSNLKPQTFLKAYLSSNDMQIGFHECNIHRVDLYLIKDNSIVTPLKIKVEV